ncbi:UDP-4-amino-4,6-dideoxy-N-acetyl-beta-L-altrosamine transaminase [bacterium (Candidatus Gribaldobacteria) CG_4_10_14_0_2_um_filter_41_16]|uniref:UDP-4-amino-4, 6-dideoxy-N-acetyl-beta-L-altrosamine transaminase n=1 Tax=bacterium (Candidatus Gribaldobacteria) CG_4_10_14_0_2_um_filter_41_16 TaxID=2014265 RepID=A0A2M7VJD0_9BACT|nr:MAG: UDP-4-amino-4,6-dideoxy-N-acetyl-beta-L-altrosamine transaminase [bacterium (Candidatus Gribaldobacteria) CG_4_10_14_0_2_um_filter_41_16]
MIPYGHQYIDKKDIEAVLIVLKSDWITQGPKILEFEKALAKYCGAKYAVVCCSGTAALHLAYLAAGLKKDDEIITSPNTFAATANMLLAVGAKPIFCDIRLDTYNIDESRIEKLITKRTKAIVPVHFAGHPCEMGKIAKIAKEHNLLVIEDACHALGAKYKGSKIGNCKYSDMAIFSFHPVKSITTGEGGATLTNNEKYYKKMISLRSHGIHKDEKGKNVMTELGFNYRMTDIQAALGVSQIKKLDKFIKARHQVARWYQRELKGLEDIFLPGELKHAYSSWHIFIIRTKNSQTRDSLASFLKEKGIGVNFHYPCVYRHPYYQKNSYKNVKCQRAEMYESTTITMPLYPGLSQKKVKYITSELRLYFNR